MSTRSSMAYRLNKETGVEVHIFTDPCTTGHYLLEVDAGEDGFTVSLPKVVAEELAKYIGF